MKIIAGLRNSKLSQVQSQLVFDALARLDESIVIDRVLMSSSGDKKRDLDKGAERDKRDWIVEIEEAVLNGQVDFAIHSAKDVPVDVNSLTMLIPLLQRAEPRDALVISKRAGVSNFSDLPDGARIGTSSLRRACQLTKLRDNLSVEELRGNVPTRLRKLDEEGRFDAIVLAAAGLIRLGYEDRINDLFSPFQLTPAVCQGILVAQCLKSRADVVKVLEKLQEYATTACFLAERQVIKCLEADCNSAVGVYAEILGESLVVKGEVLDPLGELTSIKISAEGSLNQAREIGQRLGAELLESGCRRLLDRRNPEAS